MSDRSISISFSNTCQKMIRMYLYAFWTILLQCCFSFSQLCRLVLSALESLEELKEGSQQSFSPAQIYLTGPLSLSLSVLGGLAGIGEVGQQWWPRPVRKEKARFCLGGTDKTCFQRESRSLWSDSKRGRSGSQWNNLATLMWKGKVINSSICSFLTLPFTESPAGMAESDTMH